jgi:AcrR family transcriptional regulator
VSPAAEGSAPLPDLTARTRIREAALTHFGQVGYERATVRAIAQTADVSHGMLRHHFGSKVELREACDRHACEVLHRLNTVTLDAPTPPTRSQKGSRRFWRYVARSLADGSPTAVPIFDEMITMTERWLLLAGDVPTDQPVDEGRNRAALIAAMAAAIPLVSEHLSRSVGVDIFTPEGNGLFGLALLDIYNLRLGVDKRDTAASSVGAEI